MWFRGEPPLWQGSEKAPTPNETMKTLLILSSAALAAQQEGPRPTPGPGPIPVLVPTTTPSPTVRHLPPSGEQAAPVDVAAAVPAPRARGTARNSMRPRPLAAVQFQHADDNELWARGADWKASFDRGGFTFIPFFGSEAPRNFPMRIELASATVGGEPLALAAGEPTHAEGVVQTHRGSLIEKVATALDAVEQSFVFPTLPNRGDVHVDVAMRGELAASAQATPDGVRFANEHGTLEYRKAMAVDAAGNALPLAIEWDGDSAHITIPASFVARATLPLVLDPIVNSLPNLSQTSPNPTGLNREPDVATLQAPERTIVVWQSQWSATDQDCIAEIFDSTLNYVAPAAIQVDFTSLNWVAPRVASNRGVRNFLVVGQANFAATPADTFIVGRPVTDGGTLSPRFDIERNGAVGIPGNNFRPDVGGDPFLAAPYYYAVVFEKEVAPGNRDIYYKLVLPNGTLPVSQPSALSTAANPEAAPSISKSNGGTEWQVAWQWQWTGTFTDWDVLTARIRFDGTVLFASSALASSLDNEERPSCSSPLTNGTFMVAYELKVNPTAQADIFVAGRTSQNAQTITFNLSANEAGGANQPRNQILPSIDSNGVRFVVGYSEYSGTDYDTYASTLAYDATTGFRVDETRVLLAGTPGIDDYWTRMAAMRNGPTFSSRYMITSARIGSNAIALYDYGSYAAGQFFSYYPTQCGSLTITPNGTPAIGDSVTFTANTALPSGIVFGTPGYQWLGALGCNCALGVNNTVLTSNPLTVPIPANLALVGQGFSVQGYGFSGANCFGFLDLSDTVDFTIR